MSTTQEPGKIDPRDRLRYTRKGEREALWFLGERVEFLLTGDMTDNKLMFYYHHSKPSSQPPLHEHVGEDEILFIVKGGVTFWAADQEVTLGEGDIIVLPRDLPHTFRSLPDQESGWYVLTSPASFENFIRDVAVPATHPGPDYDFEMTHEVEEHLHAAAARNGITIMAPSGTMPWEVPGGTEPVR